MTEKSILEEALLQVQKLEDAVKQNSKGILKSVMKEELNDLLKESMEDDEVDETSNPKTKGTEDVSEQPSDDDSEDETDDEDDVTSDEEGTTSDEVGDETAEFGDESSSEDELSLDNDSLDNIDPMDTDSTDDEVSSMDFSSDEDEDDVMDMTGASDSEVLKIFKSMKPEDGIIVKKDGDNIDLDLDGDEYIIKLDDQDDSTDDFSTDDETSTDDFSTDDETSTDDEFSEGKEWGDEELSGSEESIYEVELDDEGEDKKIEATEAARTKWNPHGDKGGQNRTGLKSKKMFKAGSGINEQVVSKLKKQNQEYKKALILFKDKLNEVAVFNASLAYATRLFTEHSTTKQEKLNILKRFDKVSTMNESKGLYSTIKSELGTKKPVTESVVEKISTTPSTSSSKEVLSESKAYENPQFKRMRDLMSKIK